MRKTKIINLIIFFFLVFYFFNLSAKTGLKGESNYYWKKVGTNSIGPGIFSLIINPINNDLFAGTVWGVRKSSDGGLTWRETGLNVPIVCLSMDYSMNHLIFAGSLYGELY